jgi:hypothetical protein
VQWASVKAQCSGPAQTALKAAKIFEKGGLFLVKFIGWPWFLAKFASKEPPKRNLAKPHNSKAVGKRLPAPLSVIIQAGFSARSSGTHLPALTQLNCYS